ncbi:hypothetical protein QFZ94_000115 [Paraburkholderia sp. JPY465]|uniref:hypothetical protein n=1 Tax=Paraburkholderia sp. JPY465 TaxID=3042285 RepID=UPI003D1CB632
MPDHSATFGERALHVSASVRADKAVEHVSPVVDSLYIGFSGLKASLLAPIEGLEPAF